MSISVVYWSGTGNTQAMAEAVVEGIKAAGQEAELLEVGNADAKTVAAVDALALGCPAMGAEVLEDCLLYTSPSPRDLSTSRMPSSA